MSIQIKASRAMNSPLATRHSQRGDPGLLGGLWGGIKGLVTGGPLAAISGAVSGFRGKPQAPMLPPGMRITSGGTMVRDVGYQRPPPPGMRLTSGGTMVRDVTRTPGVAGLVARGIPGGATGYEVATTNGKAPGGYHWNKSGYYTQSEGWIEAGTKLVKNRRRNPLNPRAASRAISRIVSAKKATKSLGRVTVRKACCP